jgi:hypothetical protein
MVGKVAAERNDRYGLFVMIVEVQWPFKAGSRDINIVE